MDPEVINFVRGKAREFLYTANASHAYDHVERVFNLAMHIAKKEGADLEIVALATLLHDIARPEQDASRGKIDHAEKGAAVARELLEKERVRLGLTKEKIDAIEHCIRSHRSRKESRPETLEAKVLFDADKLDSMGAVGIGRAFMFATQHNGKLHNDKDTRERILETKEYSIEDTAFREYEVKMKHLKDRLFTNEGKRIAQERHEFMEEFFRRLNLEVDGKL